MHRAASKVQREWTISLEEAHFNPSFFVRVFVPPFKGNPAVSQNKSVKLFFFRRGLLLPFSSLVVDSVPHHPLSIGILLEVMGCLFVLAFLLIPPEVATFLPATFPLHRYSAVSLVPQTPFFKEPLPSSWLMILSLGS